MLPCPQQGEAMRTQCCRSHLLPLQLNCPTCRRGLQLEPSSTVLQEAADAAELLLKQTAAEKYSSLSSAC